jgi:hypothetical protein
MRPTITADGKLNVTVQTLPGQQYQVFKTESLSTVLWVSASEVIVGTGAVIEVELPWTKDGTGFYRLIITR